MLFKTCYLLIYSFICLFSHPPAQLFTSFSYLFTSFEILNIKIKCLHITMLVSL